MMIKPTRTTKKKAKRKKLSPDERRLQKTQRDHRNAVRSVFKAAGFERATGISDKEFVFKNQSGEIDDLFVFENIVVIAEYTCAKSSAVGDHLKKKKLLFDKILNHRNEFLAFLEEIFRIKEMTSTYHQSQLIVRVIYCSKNDFDEHYKINIPGPVYMDYSFLRYFVSLSEAIKRSCRFELLYFLGIEPDKLGASGKITATVSSKDYRCLALPEAHSSFDDGYKIVSFYADPESLLKTVYVLRKDGWRDDQNLYQRMISKRKIELIRNYLKKQKRVFINNVIVTLPDEVRPIDKDRKTSEFSKLTTIEPVIISLPDKPNTVGLIDGQHRVFAYHETQNDDPYIAKLRGQQNLLVTGIICPSNLSRLEREKFEARLFLEINSTQASAKSQLKQAIGLVLDPFSNESIAARVLSQLAKSGPLAGWVAQYFFDTDKLKTTSIISFGLKPLVKLAGADSLYKVWPKDAKEQLSAGRNSSMLSEYINFCTATINTVLLAIKKNISSDRWDTDSRKKDRVITTTHINGFLICIRYLIQNRRSLSALKLEKNFNGINNFDFTDYRSSQYNRLAQKLIDVHFGIRQ